MAQSDPSRFKPGHRSRPSARGDGKMSDNRAAWCKTAIGQFVLMLEPDENEHATSVRMYHPRPGARPVSFNFTALTAEELNAVEAFFKLLIDTARPVCEYLDKVAEDALSQGDDSHARVYRQAPQFVVRSRALGPDGEGVRLGPPGVSEVVEAGPSSDGDVRRDSDDVAEQPEGDGGTQDNGSSAV